MYKAMRGTSRDLVETYIFEFIMRKQFKGNFLGGILKCMRTYHSEF